MNKMIRTFLLLAAGAAGSTALLAQPAVKLATVDMGKVYKSYYKTEQGMEKLRDAQQKAYEQSGELRKQAQTLVDEYKELVEQAKNTLLNAEAKTKAEEAAQKKLQEIQQKQNDIQTFEQNVSGALQTQEATRRQMMLEEIVDIINGMALRKGFTVILDKPKQEPNTPFRLAGAIYADPAYDITDEVIAEENKDRPAPAPATPAPAAPQAAKPAATTPAPATPGFTVPNVTKPADPAKKP